MKCQADIWTIAEDRLNDAQILYDNGRWVAAYYIAGYCVELMIKSKVCKTLGIEDFFDFENPTKTKIPIPKEAYKPFKVHDLEQLMVLSGIYANFTQDLATNNKLKVAWSIIGSWNENCRYLTAKTNRDAADLLTSIRDFKEWIQNHL